MKYKHIIFSTLLTVISLSWFSSCEDSLDVFPEDSLSPEIYFSNEQELQLYSNQFYYDIIPSASAIYSDNADAIIIATLDDEVSGQRIIPSTGSGWNFGPLRRINFLLENSSNCEDEEIRNQYEGLARFFRAYFYFEKVKRFGDVPWYDKVLKSTDEELYKPRDSREFVMQKIMEDLDFAILNLPTKKNTYRATKWTALALKSRVCLFEGTFRKYHGIDGSDFYLDECIIASDDFMRNSGYSIYKSGSAPYQDLFSSLEANGEEIILSRSYSEELGLTHSVQNYENSSTLGRPGLSKNIVNTYLTKQGTRFTDISGYETMQFYEETQNRDPRLSQTIRTPGYRRPGTSTLVAPNLSFTSTGYHLIKYSNLPQYDVYNKSVNDMPIFRTAEVLLNFAEAKAERNTIEQRDINRSIKLLRDRVGMPNLIIDNANSNPDPYLASPETGYRNVNGSNQGVILEIRRERTIELIMEGFRYYDLIRWKEGKSIEKLFTGIYIPGPGVYDLDRNGTNDVCFYEGSRPNVQATLFLEINKNIFLTEGNKGNILLHSEFPRQWIENRDYLYPVPTEERVLTNGAISQNPNWEDGLSF